MNAAEARELSAQNQKGRAENDLDEAISKLYGAIKESTELGYFEAKIVCGELPHWKANENTEKIEAHFMEQGYDVHTKRFPSGRAVPIVYIYAKWNN